MIVDFANGSPIPLGNILIDGGNQPLSELDIEGQSIDQMLNMTDNQMSPLTGGVIAFANLSVLRLDKISVSFTGDLTTLRYLYIDAANFTWH